MTAMSKEENNMNQSPNMNRQNNNHRVNGNSGLSGSMTVLFVIAGLIVLFSILYCTGHRNQDMPKYQVTIKELTDAGMVVQSESEALGAGEIRLNCADDLRVEDINGQEIAYEELKRSDNIRVSVTTEKLTGYTVVNSIILLPDDSDDYC